MPSEPGAFDRGLLAPLSVSSDAVVSDDAVLAALVTAEVALARAWRTVREDAASTAGPLDETFGWVGPGQPCTTPGIDAGEIAAAAVAGGNPVIPLVAAMRARAGAIDAADVHRGATSQDTLDTALMFVGRRAATVVLADLHGIEQSLAALAAAHRDTPAAARTLTQHAVPTTVGLRVTAWLRGIRRARRRLDVAASQLPAQLGGAGGTLAAFDAHALALTGRADAAADLPARFAAELGLAAPDAPWHTERWPVTELGDALVQTVDALGVFAGDVATGARTEIGEWIVGDPGGSSAMPQKRNPTPAVLVRSAALRAPHLGATLHTAAALAVDERPDGAWHAEWPALRDLLRVALGAAATARRLATGLAVDLDAVARVLALTDGLLVAERLSIEIAPTIGRDALAAVVAGAADGGDLAALLTAALQARGVSLPEDRVAALLDPANYTGRAGVLVDAAVEDDA